MRNWEASGRVIMGGADRVPKIMAIVNVTPDSFSDGDAALTAEAALEYARSLAAEGADVIDVGGESSRPGAECVPVAEELRRIVPVVEALATQLTVPVSVDTAKAEVARRVLKAGASIINDITALGDDPAMARAVAEAGAGLVLMHMRGVPQTMQDNPTYVNVVNEVYDFLARRVERAEEHGIPRARIALDPGIGFGKTLHHNLELLRNLGRFANLGCAVLVGTSRKGFLGTLTGRPVRGRAVASVVSALAAAVNGADVVRVHDVAATVDAIKVWTALRGWESG
jgi:dihydropteroate synthase